MKLATPNAGHAHRAVAACRVAGTRLVRGWRWARTNGKQTAIGTVIAVFAIVSLGRWLLVPLLVVVGATGVIHGANQAGWRLRMRVWILTLFTVGIPIVGLQFHFRPWVFTVAVGGLYLWLARKVPKPPPAPWHASHQRLSDVMVQAGVYKATDTPTVLMIGDKRQDALGVTRTIRLPGVHWERARDRAGAIAAAVPVQEQLLQVTHDAEQDADVWTLWVGFPRPARPVVSALCTATRTRFFDPVIVASDVQGRPVRLRTVGTHTALVAKSRAGKTWAARPLVGHALLDPTCQVYVVNGKDVLHDWRPMAPACERYVAVDVGDGVQAVLELFAELRAIAKSRKNTPPDELTPIFLLLEEWKAVRNEAARVDRQTAALLDQELEVLVALASGYGIHVLPIAQRGDSSFLPMGLKANIGQRIVGLVADPREAAYAIGAQPKVLAGAVGEFVVQADEDAGQLARWHVIDNEAWSALCGRAIALRAARAPAPVVLTKPVLAPILAHEDIPLRDLVMEILATYGPLPAGRILEHLPERHQMPIHVLGRALAGNASLRQVWQGNRQVWRVREYGERPVLPPALPPVLPPVGDAHRQQTGGKPRSNRSARVLPPVPPVPVGAAP